MLEDRGRTRILRIREWAEHVPLVSARVGVAVGGEGGRVLAGREGGVVGRRLRPGGVGGGRWHEEAGQENGQGNATHLHSGYLPSRKRGITSCVSNGRRWARYEGGRAPRRHSTFRPPEIPNARFSARMRSHIAVGSGPAGKVARPNPHGIGRGVDRGSGAGDRAFAATSDIPRRHAARNGDAERGLVLPRTTL